MLWHSLEGRLNPYHCSQTVIRYKNTVIWVIVTSSLFTEEFVLHQYQPQINWLEYTPVRSPILPSASMYLQPFCLFVCLLLNLDLQEKNGKDQLETSTYAQLPGNHFFAIDVGSEKTTVKNTAHLSQKRNSLKSNVQVQ